MGKWKKSRLHGCHGWVGWELKRVRLFGGLQLYFISLYLCMLTLFTVLNKKNSKHITKIIVCLHI